ncbi:uncharacterized protein LOC114405173 [Glycine soja]|uniref:uncharacterized protein LOC114405173 n=1 Tax=Glycine soja TaxID=3848 RepID=UPI001039D467|nr:uncharacterized protein LOC114405173 [Glycine soja]
MVRTRGLGRALGRVIGRGRGREDRDDSDDAPQRRRPIASTHRQRVSVTIVDDESVVPTDSPVVPVAEPVVATDEPMVDADTSADTDAEAAANEPEGFPSGSTNLSLLTEYAEHVAASVWTGKRPELNLSSHGRKVQKLGRPVPAIEGLVAGTGLSPLIACSVDTDDQGLISSFVERWHQEIPLHVDEAVLMLVDLLMVTPEAAKAETRHCHEPYCWIYEHFLSVAECNADPDYDEVSPRACRWIATKKTVKSISIETYRQRLN